MNIQNTPTPTPKTHHALTLSPRTPHSPRLTTTNNKQNPQNLRVYLSYHNTLKTPDKADDALYAIQDKWTQRPRPTLQHKVVKWSSSKGVHSAQLLSTLHSSMLVNLPSNIKLLQRLISLFS